MLESTMRELEGTHDPEKQAHLCRRSSFQFSHCVELPSQVVAHNLYIPWLKFSILTSSTLRIATQIAAGIELGAVDPLAGVTLMEQHIRDANRFATYFYYPLCSKSILPSFSLVDDQNGLNNYAEAILTEQDRFKNHSKEWRSSLTIDHPSIQVVSRVVKHLKCFLYLVSPTTEKWNVCMHALGLMLMND